MMEPALEKAPLSRCHAEKIPPLVPSQYSCGWKESWASKGASWTQAGRASVFWSYPNLSSYFVLQRW